MKKILLMAVLSSIALTNVYGQIDPLYAQYMSNPLVLNPAYTGLNNNFSTSVSYRKQWAGFEGSPSTMNFSAHSSFLKNKMGLGLLVVQDNIGPNKNTEANINYAYKIDMGDAYLSFGLQGGFINFRSNTSDLNPYDANDPAFTSNQNVTKVNVGAGLILKSERYFLGLSVPRMLKETVAATNAQTSIYSQHFYATAAYIFFLSQHVHFKPSLLIKGVKGAPASTDVNAAFIFEELYTLGAFTRNLNTYGVQFQVKFGKGYRFGYIFEIPTNKSVGARFTSHEINLGINFSILKGHKTFNTAF